MARKIVWRDSLTERDFQSQLFKVVFCCDYLEDNDKNISWEAGPPEECRTCREVQSMTVSFPWSHSPTNYYAYIYHQILTPESFP